MTYNPAIHHRRSIRLKGYDYTQPGAYFVTFCTDRRLHLFGEVVDGEMVLNEAGQLARWEWFKTAELRPYVKLYEDEFVIMPNHGHGILWIEDPVGARPVGVRRRRAPTDAVEQFGKPVKGSLPTIMRAYKSAVTYAVNAVQQTRGAVLWQRNYYEHIVRNDRELNNIRRYILNNPLNWQLDRDNARNTRKLPPPETAADYVQDLAEMTGLPPSDGR